MHKFSSKEIRKQNYIVLTIVILLLAVGLLVHEYFNYSLKPVSTSNSRVVMFFTIICKLTKPMGLRLEPLI